MSSFLLLFTISTKFDPTFALSVAVSFIMTSISRCTVNSDLIAFILTHTVHQMSIFSVSSLPLFPLFEPLFQFVIVTISIHALTIYPPLAGANTSTLFLSTFLSGIDQKLPAKSNFEQNLGFSIKKNDSCITPRKTLAFINEYIAFFVKALILRVKVFKTVFNHHINRESNFLWRY